MSRILLGVTGGIAAYKACELTRRLVKSGHEVIPLVTAGAQRFDTGWLAVPSLAGLVAAQLPARRAARLDMLPALASE